MPYMGDCAKEESFPFQSNQEPWWLWTFFFLLPCNLENAELLNISLFGRVKHPRNLQGGLQCIDNKEISLNSADLFYMLSNVMGSGTSSFNDREAEVK